MRARRGFTLVEVAVGAVIAAAFTAIAWNSIQLMLAGDKSVDRASVRAIREAVLLETLMRDLRSARTVEVQGPGSARIEANALEGGELRPVTITWRNEGTEAVVREQQGGATRRFDFSGLLEPGSPPFQLRIEPVEDVLFLP